MSRNNGHPTKGLIRTTWFIFILFGALVMVSTLGAPSTFAQGNTSAYVNGQVIVKYKTAIDDRNKDQVESLHGDRKVRDLHNIQSRLVKLGAGRTVEQAIQEYKSDTNVAYAEPDYVVRTFGAPNDPQYSQQWSLNNTGQSVSGKIGKSGADIKAQAAWTITTGSTSIVVGVVDTGVDYTHPDLAANVWSNPGGISGCAAGTHGYNAITGTCDPLDDNDHGTHVSGTIGAVGNNAMGVVGVNWRTQIMGLKFMDSSGSGSISDAIAAIDFAVTAKQSGVNVRVLSNSWGGSGYSQALMDEIVKAGDNGILFVVAAGNSGVNVSTSPTYPCSYSAANLICVAATDSNDNIASFSNYSSTMVHLGAPGVNILSTIRGNSYAYYNGTSMATPHVSGAAALILSAPGQSGLSVAQLKNAILSSVDPISSLAGKTTTGGRLNVCKAIPGCSGSSSPTPTPTATATSTATSISVITSTPTPVITSTPTKSATATRTATPTTTRVASPTATRVPASDYSITASPSARSLTPGMAASYVVTLMARNGYSSRVNLSVSGLPAGAVATFSPNPLTPAVNGAMATLSITTGATTPAGNYTLTITGKGMDAATTTHATTVNLSVGNVNNTGRFGLVAGPGWLFVRRNSTGKYTVRVSSSGGFNAPVTLSVSGLPSSVKAAFSASPVTPSSGAAASSTLTITTGNSAGFYTLTIAGTGGGRTITTWVGLYIY